MALTQLRTPSFNNGVAVYGGAQNNVIGGTSGGARNFISGHAQYGLFIADAGTTGNLVQGNTIGLNVVGSAKPNSNPGVALSTAHNQIQLVDQSSARVT